jgi:hypothetical protein
MLESVVVVIGSADSKIPSLPGVRRDFREK